MKCRHYFRKVIRVMLFLFAVVAYDSVSAQDVIITRDSKRIDASVQEISDTEVRYKRTDNPDGPVFVIKTQEISSIMFANGEVQSFENVEAEPPQQQATSNSGYGYTDYPVVVSKGHMVRYTPGGQMKLDGFAITYNGVELGKDACEDFFKATCPAAYNHYQNAVLVGYLADAFLEVGETLCIWGLVYGLVKEPDATTSEADIEANTTAFFAWGAACAVLSIPFYVWKLHLKTKSVQTFNEQCRYRPQSSSVASLSFKVSPMGAGLALNF